MLAQPTIVLLLAVNLEQQRTLQHVNTTTNTTTIYTNYYTFKFLQIGFKRRKRKAELENQNM